MSYGLNAFQDPNSAGENGFGVGSESEISNLAKALETGYQIGAGRTGGAALRVESLEASLKVLTYTASHIKLWKKIPKSPAYSTVEEYNQLSDYGGRQNPFVGEGELPQATDTSYVRRTELVKFMGTTREVTHQATVVHPAHGDLIALENHNGILWLLQEIERFLFQGDASLAFDGEAEQWNGLDTLIDATSLTDLAGESLQEAVVEEASNEIIEAFGFPTDMYLGTRTMGDFTKTFYPKERVALPAPVNGQVGNAIQSMSTQGGVIQFQPDVFIRETPAPPTAATSPNAPDAPAIPTSALTGATDGDFNKAGIAGGDNEYSYVVTAANRFGESAPSPIQAANTVIDVTERDALDSFDVTITNAAAIGGFPPEYFRVYRTVALAASAAVPTALTDFALVAQLPATSQTAAATGATFRDVNLQLPFTSTAYMGEMTPSVLTFRQLMPMMKMDLAVLSPAYRWMILLYGTPLLFAPKKWHRLINIGRLER